ncbi:MAG: hypothetical protein J0L96_14140 [Anaerolineae bacterium]|nr:hypothetical protein [Anaerolineae bacterium]
MFKANIKLLCCIFFSFLLSCCSKNGTPLFNPFATALFSTCSLNNSYIGSWTAKEDGIFFEAFLCPDDTLIAVFHNQDYPDLINVNPNLFISPEEYVWKVYVDVDSNKKTGLSETEITKKEHISISGSDYILSLGYPLFGRKEPIPFDQLPTNVWKCDGDYTELDSYAKKFTDKTNRIIILKGKIPGINKNSQISFLRVNLNEDDKVTYHTDWITFILAP